MGIDISMTFGWGIHLEPEQIDAWLGPDDEYGSHEGMERLLSEYPGLSFAWAGNAWVGEDNGFVVYADNTTSSFDMGREAEAGVYRAATQRVSAEDSSKLNEISWKVAGEKRPIEWLVTVAVN